MRVIKKRRDRIAWDVTPPRPVGLITGAVRGGLFTQWELGAGPDPEEEGNVMKKVRSGRVK